MFSGAADLSCGEDWGGIVRDIGMHLAAIIGIRTAILHRLQTAWRHSVGNRAQAKSALHLLVAGQGFRARFEEIRCQDSLGKPGGCLLAHVKRSYESCASVPRAFTRVCLKKADMKYSNVYLMSVDEKVQAH